MRRFNEKNMAFKAEALKCRSGSKHLTPCLTNPNDLQLPDGPVYDAIHENLIQDECLITAKYFDKLVAMENDLVQTDLKFKKRLRTAHCLLLAVVENVKSAETAYKVTNNKELTLKLLVQTVHMIQAQDDAFRWLIKELYKIILHISRQWEDECVEMLARIRYEYGVVLTEKGDDYLNEAINQMSKALEACKGTLWYTNDRDRNILHEDVCVSLCETFLRQARLAFKTNPKRAADLANRAVLTITEVGISGHKNIYCVSKLRQAEYLIASGDNEGAMNVLNSIHGQIMSYDSPRNKCEYYFWLGICHFKQSANNLALRKFKVSLTISEADNLADLKANTLLYMGKIHAEQYSTQELARQCFVESKELFKILRDVENEKLARFLMAKLRTYQIFPSYIELIRRSTWTRFCDLFHLIQWKQKMLPFWNDEMELRCYEDNYQCLLEEDLSKEPTVPTLSQ